MSNQALLSDAQIELLRSLPSNPDVGSAATREGFKILARQDYDFVSPLYLAGLVKTVEIRGGVGEPKGGRTPAADILLATLDHHTNQAKEDERRRICRCH